MRTTIVCLCMVAATAPRVAGDERELIERGFQQVVRPFITTYCTGCHGGKDPKAKFDLSPYQSLESVVAELGHWELVLERIQAGEMPPDDARRIPSDEQRRPIVEWIERLRRHEAAKHAGDPGAVLARRLSNAEYDYSIHDLTGVDIRPTREFPIDPASEAGFDNTGESLTMSPALLNKYLAAARLVADHLLFLPDGLAFAPYPVVTYSDRDKFVVHRIVDFYKRQPTDYSATFFAAWRYRHRAAHGTPDISLDDVARDCGVSAKYLKSLWSLLTDGEDQAGPIAGLRAEWDRLPQPGGDDHTAAARAACDQLAEFVRTTRSSFQLPTPTLDVQQLNKSSQPIILWKNRAIAANRRAGKLPESDGTDETERLRRAVARFCNIFPDAFYVSERGRMFLDPKEQEKGRLLSAGFHLMLGYFRDDAPLYDLVLEPGEQRELDRMWQELDFIAQAPLRQFTDFVYFERAEHPGFLKSPEFDFAREDSDIAAEAKLLRLATLYLAKAHAAGITEPVIDVIEKFFHDTSDRIRHLEKSLAEAEPKHLDALVSFAERAWRRPITDRERRELAAFYRVLRDEERLSHEDAVRDTLVSLLMSPHFCYRVTAVEPGSEPVALSEYELASRLSYFLWSSMPDAELLSRAAAGELHRTDILLQQTRRMLADPRARRLATEFVGNWLDFRRFPLHQGVNRERFPQFTNELRQAMYEEPIRFVADLIERNGSILELIEGRHTFVNAVLAKHYGIPLPEAGDGWVRIDDATPFGRGGLLPMAVFLTQNSPGLRTSPVKRGYWVVRRLLGEHIPAPPPEVPDLPEDESKLELPLRELLARHRETKSCAVCHRRFDSIGLVFESYGPIGERRQADLGGKPVETSADFPDGRHRDGIAGLADYLRETRQADLLDNLCRKLLAYALGRSLMLSDEPLVERLKDRLARDEYRIAGLFDTIVTSQQFLRKRGRDYADRNSKNQRAVSD